MGEKSYTFHRVPERRTKTIAVKLQWNVVACLKKKTWETCEGRSSRRVSGSCKWEFDRRLWSEIVLIISMPCRSHIKGMGLIAWSWCKKWVFGAGLPTVIWEPPYHRFPFLWWKQKALRLFIRALSTLKFPDSAFPWHGLAMAWPRILRKDGNNLRRRVFCLMTS